MTEFFNTFSSGYRLQSIQTQAVTNPIIACNMKGALCACLGVLVSQYVQY